MLTVQIDFDQLLKVVEQLSDEQKHILQQRMAASPSTSPSKPLKKRVAGLGEGTIWISDDFDDPLPDKFWLDAI